MSYFQNEKCTKSVYSESSRSEELLAELGNICFEELMLSSDAYVCMIKLNLHGYKRLHRNLSKTFYDIYLELQNKSVEMFNKALPIADKFDRYTTKDIKSHLEDWNIILKEHLHKVGEIIKGIFEEEGYIPCIAQKIQKILYKNIIKNERAIHKFEDCDWDSEIIYIHDRYLHEKEKEYK